MSNDAPDKIPDKIEVTDAMVRAGSRALATHYLSEGVYDLTDPTLVEVYLAMRRLESKSP